MFAAPPAFDQHSQAYYDRAGARSLQQDPHAGGWLAEALEQKALLETKWRPGYGVDFRKTQRLFRKAEHSKGALSRWRPQLPEPRRRNARRATRPRTPAVSARAEEGAPGFAEAERAAEAARQCATLVTPEVVRRLADVDAPPPGLALAAAAALAFVETEFAFDSLHWKNFVKVADADARAFVVKLRRLDYHDVKPFKLKAFEPYLEGAEPEFEALPPDAGKPWAALDAWVRAALAAGFSCAHARRGLERPASRSMGKAKFAALKAKRGPPPRDGAPPGWPRCAPGTVRRGETGEDDAILVSMVRNDLGPDPVPRGDPRPCDACGDRLHFHTGSLHNFPTRSTVSSGPLPQMGAPGAWLVTILKRGRGGYEARAYHPGARVETCLRVSDQLARESAETLGESVATWAYHILPHQIEMFRAAGEYRLRLGRENWLSV